MRDHLGSVMQGVDANDRVKTSQRYSAYGVLSSGGNGPVKNPTSFGYAGMWRHGDSGLNLTWFRAYDPSSGRWLSRDPIGEAGGINLYGYVGGNPAGWNDPYGLWLAIPMSYGIEGLAALSNLACAAFCGSALDDLLDKLDPMNQDEADNSDTDSGPTGECPAVPEDYTGKNRRGDGKTDLPGGEKARDDLFDKLTGGQHVQDGDQKIGPNGVRSRTGADGRPRLDIPAPESGARGPETIHFND